MNANSRLILLLTLAVLPLSLHAQDLPRRGLLGAMLDSGADGKVVVRKVLPGGAAEAMKLAEGTTILALNGAWYKGDHWAEENL